MRYVDGFVIPVPKKKLKAYAKMAKAAGKIWMEHGALEFLECSGDDLNTQHGLPFTKLAKAKPGETILFSFIVYKSRTHRDRVNAKVMSDPRLKQSMEGKEMPFDMKRMSYGGFKTIVDLTA
jgi:uncharacterized protein YbaA (DUF1428 family)